MKKLTSILVAGALCASCLAFAGCGGNDATESDSELDADIAAIVEELNPVGSYVFDSIGLETPDGTVTAAGIDAEWEGQVLSPDYASVVFEEDGTLVCSGALEATGTWAFDSDGIFGVDLNLSEGEVSGCSIDGDGMFTLDITLEDGSILYYVFIR